MTTLLAEAKGETMPKVETSSDRFLALEQGFNLRDFGGYPTIEGRRVKRKRLYRSGIMSLLTPADEDKLRALGISAIYDFRRQNERQAQPTRWHEGTDVKYSSRDYPETTGVLVNQLHDANVTPEIVRQNMTALYREIPVDLAPAYLEMFRHLARGELPLLINCTGGKDRTGVGAALILSILGVPREYIVEDYAATDDADWDMVFARDETFKAYRLATPEADAQQTRADPVYIKTLLDWMASRYGGVEPYLISIGVEPIWLPSIRDTLLEA